MDGDDARRLATWRVGSWTFGRLVDFLARRSTFNLDERTQTMNPMEHLIKHLDIAPREAIMQEIVRVWSENQEMVRFEAFQARLLHLHRLTSHTDFVLGATELVLWFGKEAPYEKSVPHTVAREILESYLLRTTTSFLETLSPFNQKWRVLVQADMRRVQISDPRLGWKGVDVPWQKAADAADMLAKTKKWTSRIYIKALGEAQQVMWINPHERTMSCCNLAGGCRVDDIDRWLRYHQTQQTNPVYAGV